MRNDRKMKTIRNPLAVADVNSTAGYLDAAGVRYLRDGETLLRLAPDYACGVVIEFASG